MRAFAHRNEVTDLKKRLVSAFFGIILFFAVMVFLKTWVFNIVVAFITLAAVYEVFQATGLTTYKGLSTICFISAFLTSFMPLLAWILPIELINVARAGFLLLVIFSIFCSYLTCYKTLRIEQVGMAFLATFAISLSFATVVFMRDAHLEHSLLYMLIVFSISWFADTGAYFAGRFFGKHKLAPNISPKKTVEGAVGGVVSSVLFSGLITWGYSVWIGVEANYCYLGIAALVGAFLGILGDLTASLIKRQYNIKDFGNIMPGHGGIMDRFDSVLFVAPFLFIFSQIFTITR